MILCEINLNAILVEPMKNWISSKMSRAYKTLIQWLKVAGIYPRKHIVDKEGSDNFLQLIKNKGMVYEKVPPHMHWCNAAEKAI